MESLVTALGAVLAAIAVDVLKVFSCATFVGSGIYLWRWFRRTKTTR